MATKDSLVAIYNAQKSLLPWSDWEVVTNIDVVDREEYGRQVRNLELTEKQGLATTMGQFSTPTDFQENNDADSARVLSTKTHIYNKIKNFTLEYRRWHILKMMCSPLPQI